jgi:hypothetical protein
MGSSDILLYVFICVVFGISLRAGYKIAQIIELYLINKTLFEQHHVIIEKLRELKISELYKPKKESNIILKCAFCYQENIIDIKKVKERLDSKEFGACKCWKCYLPFPVQNMEIKEIKANRITKEIKFLDITIHE